MMIGINRVFFNFYKIQQLFIFCDGTNARHSVNNFLYYKLAC